MKIVLNEMQEEIPFNEISINDLLKYKSFTFKMLVIKVNGKLIKKPDYDHTIVKDGDNVIILHLISGG